MFATSWFATTGLLAFPLFLNAIGNKALDPRAIPIPGQHVSVFTSLLDTASPMHLKAFKDFISALAQ